MRSFAVRRQQWEAARAALPADTFAPFTTVEWTTLPIEGFEPAWSGRRRRANDPPIVPGTPYPSVPVLVLNGDLDIVTTTDEAQAAAARFPNATYVEIANSVHVTALGDRDNCSSQIMYRFVRTLAAGDTSCASRVPEVRTIILFPRTQADVTPATPRPANRASLRARRVAAAAAMTVADAVQRWQINFSGVDRGLRGGTWSYSGDRKTTFAFDDARFVNDVRVTGFATWNLDTGRITGTVVTRGPGGLPGRIRFSWSLEQAHGIAQLRGTVGGHRLDATMLAPERRRGLSSSGLGAGCAARRARRSPRGSAP